MVAANPALPPVMTPQRICLSHYQIERPFVGAHPSSGLNDTVSPPMV